MLVIFDVNETLSDMAPLAARFEEVGLRADEMGEWFAGVLRDGFALTVVGENPTFADLAATSLRSRLDDAGVGDDAVEDGVRRVLEAFGGLAVHPDVVAGVEALNHAGARLVTLSNGSAGIADGLLTRAGIRADFEQVLSVTDAPAWKPAGPAYAYALEACGVEASDAVLVAVHPWDIDGAARAGLRTGWLNRAGRTYPATFTAPDVVGTDLVDLARRLAGHAA